MKPPENREVSAITHDSVRYTESAHGGLPRNNRSHVWVGFGSALHPAMDLRYAPRYSRASAVTSAILAVHLAISVGRAHAGAAPIAMPRSASVCAASRSARLCRTAAWLVSLVAAAHMKLLRVTFSSYCWPVPGQMSLLLHGWAHPWPFSARSSSS